jgi:hypothetical protein
MALNPAPAAVFNKQFLHTGVPIRTGDDTIMRKRKGVLDVLFDSTPLYRCNIVRGANPATKMRRQMNDAWISDCRDFCDRV